MTDWDGLSAGLKADNLALRDRFIAEVEVLSSAQLGSEAELWKLAGEIFSVEHRGAEVYPAFQFQDGKPHRTVAKVLAVLPDDFSDWQKAFWFVAENGWLGNREPIEMLDNTEVIVAAALHEREEFIG